MGETFKSMDLLLVPAVEQLEVLDAALSSPGTGCAAAHLLLLWHSCCRLGGTWAPFLALNTPDRS